MLLQLAGWVCLLWHVSPHKRGLFSLPSGYSLFSTAYGKDSYPRKRATAFCGKSRTNPMQRSLFKKKKKKLIPTVNVPKMDCNAGEVRWAVSVMDRKFQVSASYPPKHMLQWKHVLLKSPLKSASQQFHLLISHLRLQVSVPALMVHATQGGPGCLVTHPGHCPCPCLSSPWDCSPTTFPLFAPALLQLFVMETQPHTELFYPFTPITAPAADSSHWSVQPWTVLKNTKKGSCGPFHQPVCKGLVQLPASSPEES